MRKISTVPVSAVRSRIPSLWERTRRLIQPIGKRHRPLPLHAPHKDDGDLAQRVRETGEW